MKRDEAEVRQLVSRHLQAIAPEIEPADIPDDAPLREEADIDSYDFLNLLVRLSEELQVEIPEADYPQLQTLGGLVRYLAAATASG
ncbi:acyl carrier protein [Vulgatibacter sp.]|uniref:acyl carrier protein n=1 Tax=Vulgatibacter sp. TaxID=1971226 RepID=UPI00356A432E